MRLAIKNSDQNNVLSVLLFAQTRNRVGVAPIRWAIKLSDKLMIGELDTIQTIALMLSSALCRLALAFQTFYSQASLRQ
jgi:hypothetical protein